jgi:hypothetical protein
VHKSNTLSPNHYLSNDDTLVFEKVRQTEEFNKIFSGYQLHHVVKWRVNQHFENYLCPRRQGTD